ncbi:MAG: phospholipase D-like domain-containing protein [Myxococcota bacterium]|nr:phospholipase D-like domain-containing protein [Myxococcota bacterium]
MPGSATPCAVTIPTIETPDTALQTVHLGGPGSRDGALRDLLVARVRASGRGDLIDFVTYYFRDRRLAAELAAAAGRGVEVRVTLEARPRRADANTAVAAQLARPVGDGGIGGGLKLLEHSPLLPGTRARPRLHEKLYVFSNPPTAFVGSFNPSGDDPELAPEVTQEIGDHDRGYNLLVELRDSALVEALTSHARNIQTGRHGFFERFQRDPSLSDEQTELAFWPRVGAHPFFAKLGELGGGDRARIVASHVSGKAAIRALAAAASRGANVELLSHANARRFPQDTEARLRASGVVVQRVGTEATHPMHDKFALLDCAGVRCAAFGSYNLNTQSRWLNHEIGVFTRDAGVYTALEQRWEQLQR